MASDHSSEHHARQRAIARIRDHRHAPDADVLLNRIISGDAFALSEAITLSESTLSSHRETVNQLIRQCLPHTGKALRVGITGVPGVGKSTFIEALGTHLTKTGLRIAVLAVDPTSPMSGGSILGDKTRMSALSVNPMAFIRPSPSALAPGGVARHTRENIMLCEAAGFDVILVETVGVGQGEVAVHAMTDFFLLLMLAGAGDQLQGIKRGIMELCDGMAITKCDGDNITACRRAQADYTSALHLFPPRDSKWAPQVLTTSAQTGEHIPEVWELIRQHEQWMKERNLFFENRHTQDVQWMHDTIRGNLFDRLHAVSGWRETLHRFELEVRSGTLNPFDAADQLLDLAIRNIH